MRKRSGAAVASARGRRRRRSVGVLCAGVLLAAAPVVAGTAVAGAQGTSPLPSSLREFAHCPIADPAVTACLSARMGGTFQVGDASLTLPKPATVTLGLISSMTSQVTAVLPTDGTPGLQSPTVEIPVAGGLVQVGATPTLAAPPTLDLAALLGRSGVAISLPLVVDLSNAALGSTCTIGTTASPLTVDLTDGTTDPPPPNQPVTGALGRLTSKEDGLLTVKGVTLVDNAFAAPGASGCGPLGIEDGVIDAAEGLPSAAGTNAATLSGTVHQVPASLIRQYLG